MGVRLIRGIEIRPFVLTGGTVVDVVLEPAAVDLLDDAALEFEVEMEVWSVDADGDNGSRLHRLQESCRPTDVTVAFVMPPGLLGTDTVRLMVQVEVDGAKLRPFTCLHFSA